VEPRLAQAVLGLIAKAGTKIDGGILPDMPRL
jgi:hypothetical protein